MSTNDLLDANYEPCAVRKYSKWRSENQEICTDKACILMWINSQQIGKKSENKILKFMIDTLNSNIDD